MYSSFIDASFLCLALMMLGFVVSKLINLTSLIDSLWSISPLFISWYLIIKSPLFQSGILLLLVITCWSLRLSLFILFTRVLKKHEDPRYKEIITNTSPTKKNKAIFFQYTFQWFLQIVLSLSFLPFFWQSSQESLFLLYIGFSLSFIGILGETKADFELLRFKN